ncbi:organic solute transporter alpha-like protein 2 X2 [Biomphalaria pfeifferi]|uniref:Organic solute transporter alpha-like protein 2 X2 n=1 Tax=Biomphalaria pfeifferi TaxID=112525 RepID=A0AAD8AUV7_BIOPF|nr:organic solute transporter alpha-like protein 2 X2 [Biomphalaria pfeifferi]
MDNVGELQSPSSANVCVVASLAITKGRPVISGPDEFDSWRFCSSGGLFRF